jgi:hypothetical protein
VLTAAAALLPGCGLGAGSQEGTVDLTVSRDYGHEILLDEKLGDLTESETAMRVLDRSADLETRYGGGFVQAVDGLEGGSENGRRYDWFFAVNGVVAELGSADFPVHAGDRVWWDHRDWTDAMEVGAVVGSYPAPMSTGYGDNDWPVRIDCGAELTTCEIVRRQLANEDIEATITTDPPEGADDEVIRFIVGPWDELRLEEAAMPLASEPARSGVFAKFDTRRKQDHLLGLDQRGEEARDFGPEAGLIAARRRGEGPPVWLVTGGSEQGVEAAAAALTAKDLEHRYAAVVFDGRVASLPLE